MTLDRSCRDRAALTSPRLQLAERVCERAGTVVCPGPLGNAASQRLALGERQQAPACERRQVVIARGVDDLGLHKHGFAPGFVAAAPVLVDVVVRPESDLVEQVDVPADFAARLAVELTRLRRRQVEPVCQFGQLMPALMAPVGVVSENGK